MENLKIQGFSMVEQGVTTRDRGVLNELLSIVLEIRF